MIGMIMNREVKIKFPGVMSQKQSYLFDVFRNDEYVGNIELVYRNIFGNPRTYYKYVPIEGEESVLYECLNNLKKWVKKNV